MEKNDIKYILVHCSNSLWGSAEVIKKWHTDPPPKGNGWKDIGYHIVINNGYLHSKDVPAQNRNLEYDGLIEYGRPPKNGGAHCPGYNNKSIAICLIGRYHFTQKQMQSLFRVLTNLIYEYNIPINNVLGHYETKSGRERGKTCPNLDMDVIRTKLRGMIITHDKLNRN